MTAVQGYAYDNQSAHAVEHHDALAAMLDTHTRRRIEELVDLPGKRCLEVAAGAGSIATWMAERVGPQGHVLATDLKPQRIPDYPGLEVRQHDITSDEPLGRYDLVHARLLLNHLPERRTALRNMIGALQPGGAVLTEDFWPTVGEELVAYGPDPAHALVARYQTLHLQILASHGNDRNWSRGALLAFQDEGLADVRVTVHGSSWRGGDPGCRLLRAGMGQLHDQVIALGMTDEELEQVAEALMDPRLIINGYLVYLTSGRRPA
ncbi:MAG TPA: class I SAM-dependent methyltransferase [Rugosimonospora sp.]|nr:class I SAM-dependent methyltransferase [Rugosimonospora sp.]